MTTLLFLERLNQLAEVPPHSAVYLALCPKQPDFDRQVHDAIQNGFAEPVVIDYHTFRRLLRRHQGTRSYLASFRRGYRVCLHYLGEKCEKYEPSAIIRHVEYCLKKYNAANVCTTRLQFDAATLDFLYYQTRHHRFEVNGKKVQREISGLLHLHPERVDLVIASIDEKSTKMGDKENADLHKTFGSFHTHPYDAYRRHEVCVAFPSAEDYATTMYLYGQKIGAFHVLSSIEGVYVISVKPSFMKRHSPEDVNKHMKKWEEKVAQKYDNGYPECSLSRDNHAFWQRYMAKYLKKINRLDVFDVQFKRWRQARAEPFQLQYRPVHKNCILTDAQFRHLKRLSSSE